jgi:hypothetical protein
MEEIFLERENDTIMKLDPEEEDLYNEIEIAPTPRRKMPPRPMPKSFRSRPEPEEHQDGLDAFMNPHKHSAPEPTQQHYEEEYPEEEDFDDYEDEGPGGGGGGGGGWAQPAREQPSSGYRTIDEEKADLLNKLSRLEKRGFTINKKLSMYSSVDDIRSEVKRITYSIEVDQSVKFSRRMLIACVTGLEFLNKRYNPVDIHLEGWSESVMENVDDYDQVFEELYAKYRTKMQMAPEVKLIMMVSGSAMMYHLTSSMFKSALPNMGQVIKQNPDLVKNMMSAVQNTVNNNAQASADAPGRDGGYEMQGPGVDLSSLMGNIMMPPPPPMSTSSIQVPKYDPTEHEEEDDLSDIVSDRGVEEQDDDEVKDIEVKTTTRKKRGGSRKKKTEINL